MIERIDQPMAKLRQMMRLMLSADDAKDVIKEHAAVHAALREFERQQYEMWEAEVEGIAFEKLKQPLLLRGLPHGVGGGAADGSGGLSSGRGLDSARGTAVSKRSHLLLTVNFDPALVCLLREIHYLVRLGTPIPRAAEELYRQSETLRVQIGNLQMIASRCARPKDSVRPSPCTVT